MAPPKSYRDQGFPGPQKLSHKTVTYGMAGHDQGRCDHCMHYEKPGASQGQAVPHCEGVVDPISPAGHCTHFKEKTMDYPKPMAAAAPVQADKGDGAGDVDRATAIPMHHHAMSIGGAKHMLAGGHITKAQHDMIVASARKALAKRNVEQAPGESAEAKRQSPQYFGALGR